MNEQITLQMLPRSRIEHDSHWISIKHCGERVGFIKGVIEGNTVTIEFLHMFDEFGGCGYALRAIEALKSKFTVKLNKNDLWLYEKYHPQVEI